MLKILVVDDEPMICEEFKDILQDEGHEVDTALNGIEAIRKVQEKEYELVFLDVLMPKMEGSEALVEIKKLTQTPVVVMSGYLAADMEVEVRRAGAYACLRKPFKIKEIQNIIIRIEQEKSGKNK